MTDLSTIEARKQLAAKHAAPYGLDVALVCAVAHHESGWYPFADRHEPAFYDRYIQPLINQGKVRNITEAKNRATSYGLMQVMGQVARELGCTARSLVELTDPDLGIEFGCKKLKECIDKHPSDQRAALLAYNGGGDPGYPDLVLKWYRAYSGDSQ